MQPDFPIEVVLDGNPRSLQASAESLRRWKHQIASAISRRLPEGAFLTEAPIRFRLFWFSDAEAPGDLDNMIKPILDAAARVLIRDDQQVQTIQAEHYPPSRPLDLIEPSNELLRAVAAERPCVYICFDERS